MPSLPRDSNNRSPEKQARPACSAGLGLHPNGNAPLCKPQSTYDTGKKFYSEMSGKKFYSAEMPNLTNLMGDLSFYDTKVGVGRRTI